MAAMRRVVTIATMPLLQQFFTEHSHENLVGTWRVKALWPQTSHYGEAPFRTFHHKERPQSRSV
jgi:hypothetical protein